MRKPFESGTMGIIKTTKSDFCLDDCPVTVQHDGGGDTLEVMVDQDFGGYERGDIVTIFYEEFVP